MKPPNGPRKRTGRTSRRIRLAVESLGERALPSTLWGPGIVPTEPAAADRAAIEVGVKFQSEAAGYVTGIRFYKGLWNTGTHTGSVWNAAGDLLGTATFTGESAAGWQEAEFATPLAIAADTAYVASYFAPHGGYAFDADYFDPAGVDSPPLHAPADGANGLFRYGSSAFPTEDGQGSNYWVDVRFDTSPADVTRPRAVARAALPGATQVSLRPTVTAEFTESVRPASLAFTLTGPNNAAVAAAVNYDDASRTATLIPTTALTPLTTYTARVFAADRAGNGMAAPLTWSFTTGDPAQMGEWATPVNWPLVAINSILLSNGKVLVWDGGADCIAPESARVWDPVTGEFTPVPLDHRDDTNDIFCAGAAALPDGRILVVGGHDCDVVGVGIKLTNIFDPVTGTWTPGPDLTYARWYPTVTALPDGKVLVTSGSDAVNESYVRVPEVFDPATNTWTVLDTASAYIPSYPYIYVLPDGRVLEAGSTEYDSRAVNPVPSRVLDLKTGRWTTVDPTSVDGGSSVMYRPGKVMKSGSAYEANIGLDEPASAGTAVLDMTADDPRWQAAAPMNHARAYHNLTLLPDGAVLATGGSAIKDPNKLAPAVRTAEVWDPATGLWTGLPDAQVPRVYHSTAVLLPDGRVLTAGGGRNYDREEANQFNAEVYSPPYLFRGPRPVVTAAPAAVTIASQFAVQTPDAASIREVALIRAGTVTHGFDMDQRYVPLNFRQTAGGLVVEAPADGNTAPPGHYMLFLVNADGVPSVAPLVRLTAPTVAAASPAYGATGVATANARVEIRFGQAVDPATVNSATVALLSPTGQVVPASVSYNAGTNMAVLVPTSPLAASTTYTIVVRGNAGGPRVATPAGDPLAADFVSFFRTAAPTEPGVYSLWSGADVPAAASVDDQNAVSLGLKFRVDAPGYVTGVRFYKGAGNTGTHVGHLWDAAGSLLATATFANETASGWQTVSFTRPVAVRANTTYVASYFAPNGGYAIDTAYFTADVPSGPLHGLARGYGEGFVSSSNTFPTDGANGLFRYGADGFPTDTNNASNYWVDVVFTDAAGPAVTATAPNPGGTGVAPTAAVTATFSEPVDPATVGFVLTDAVGVQVPAAVTYDAATRTAKLTPSAGLHAGATYTATLRDAVNAAGYPLALPATWSFTVASGGTFSMWSTWATPAVPSANDGNAVELGVRFRADAPGYVTGVRFYKGAGNTGAHVGHLWDAAGSLLATAAFTGETASGWQQATFADPVPLQAGAAYVVSYYAPVGHYSYTLNYFTQAQASGPLTAPASGPGLGNGVYKYGGGFPSEWNAAAPNYWVDLTFAAAADLTPPTVAVRTPAAGATAAPAAIPVMATFSEPVQGDTVHFTLTDPAGVQVPASLTYDASTQTARLTPTADLRANATYTATVSGARDLAGNLMATDSWWFVTAAATYTLWPATAAPAVPAAADGNPVEVGVRFTTAEAGSATGVRFYKGAGNTGAHVGHLWDAAGNLLATAAFTGETASGWQQTAFAAPVRLQPGATYLVSYYAPAGHYAYSGAYFGQALPSGPLTAPASSASQGNGVYRYGAGGGFPTDSYNATNYWVDLTFAPADVTPPTVATRAPAAGAAGVALGVVPSAVFSEPIQANTLTFVLTDPAGVTVPATVTYDAPRQKAMLTPAAPLRPDTTYAVSVSGAQDLAGNAMTPTSWTFATDRRWVQSSAADFGTGSGSGTAVTATGGGGVALAYRRDDFAGSAVDLTQWAVGSWTGVGGGTTSVAVSGGVLSVRGGAVTSVQPAAGAVVEGRLAFGRQAAQHFGLATGLVAVVGNSWAMFSTWGTSDTLYARVNVAGSETNVSLGAIPSGYHDYRVAPVAGGYAFWIDGTVAATVAGAIPTPQQLSVVASDYFGNAANPLLVDSASVLAYPTDGTFTSAVFEAGSAVTWGAVMWTATTPAGTSLVVETRTTDDPNGGWSAWAAASNGSAVASPPGRFVQYRVRLTTSDPRVTPELLDLSLTWL